MSLSIASIEVIQQSYRYRQAYISQALVTLLLAIMLMHRSCCMALGHNTLLDPAKYYDGCSKPFNVQADCQSTHERLLYCETV